MRRRPLLVFGVVLLALVLSVQLAYTNVGREVGPHWSEPTELAAFPADGDAEFVSLSADGDPAGGAVAWIERRGDRYRVRLARLSATGGNLSLGEPRTIARTSQQLATVRVAREGDRVAVTWERTEVPSVALWTTGTDRTRVVSPPETPSLNEPGVTHDGEHVVLAWQAFRSGRGGFTGHLAALDGNASHRTFGGEVGGEHSPTVIDRPEGVALAWVNADDETARLAFARPNGSGGYAVGEVRSLGRARSLSSFGGSGPPATVDAAVLDRGTVVLRQDLGDVYVARVTNGSVSQVPVLEDDIGKLPRLAGGSERWLSTYVVEHRASGQDVAYAMGRGEVTERGTLSRLASNAVYAEPLFAGDPAAVWTETGAERALYASAYRADASGGPVERLAANPFTFAFIGVAAPAAGAVTMPLLPWVAGPFLLGFLLTTRVALDAVSRPVAWLRSRTGTETSTHDVRKRLQGAPAWVGFGLYALANVALFARLGADQVLVAGVAFADPLALSALALAGTVPVALSWRTESPWRLAALFAFLQSTALWASSLSGFL